MSSRVLHRRALPLAAALLLPALAHAQEPQPWTNTSAYGDRVVPALPASRKDAVVVRVDGGTGSTKPFKLTETRGGPPDGEETSATFLSGRSGASYGNGPWEVFATSYAYRVTIPKLKEDPANGPLAVNPYTQTGDAAVGARWTKAVTSSANFGLEGGAVFLGATGDPGNTGVVFAGPAFSATSPFARALFTWQGMKPPRGETGALTASVNAGVFADQSWNVWEQAAKDADREEATGEPLAEERIAMSFYGDEGSATRIVFGAGVAYDVAPFARPFLELTGESTSPDLTMRLTPGVAFRPTGNVALFVSADLDLSGDPEVSPRAPAFRANAGLQVAFGARVPRDEIERGAAPRPSPTPNPGRRFPISLRVVDENGRPVSNAVVKVFRASPPPGPDDEPIGEGKTQNGTVTINTPDSTRFAPGLLVTAKHPDYMEWLPIQVSPKMNPMPAIVLYQQRTQVALQFVSCVPSWPLPPGVRVSMQPLPSGNATPRGKRQFSGTEPIVVPADSDSFRRWTIRVDVPDLGITELSTEELLPNQAIRLYVDPDKKCIDFQQAKCACAAVPIATPTPAAQLERTTYAIFEGDSVDVKPEEAMKLYQKLLPLVKQPHKVVVQAKKGDPIFQSALAAARRDALSAWLNSKGIPGGTVNYAVDSEAKTDAVILEVSK